MIQSIAHKFRDERCGNRIVNVSPLPLLHQLDDENVPVECNIFETSAAHELVEEFNQKANAFVAQKLFAEMPDKAFLRRQAAPNPRRLQTFVERMNRLGFEIDPSSSGSLQSSLCKVADVDLRKVNTLPPLYMKVTHFLRSEQGMETLLVKAIQFSKYYVSSCVKDYQRHHYTLNLPLYTHFTNPTRRYADIIVHRQLDSILSNGAVEFTDDIDSLNKTAELCNNKKDSAHNAQEQSVHIEACRNMDKKRQEVGGDLVSEGIVLCVYESAFDVLIPEYGFEKRVHCDQLPLKKAEFRKETRVLELYWERGVSSSAYVPEDERPKSTRAAQAAAAAREAEARARESEEAMRKQTETGTMSADDVEALFDDDDDGDDDDNSDVDNNGVALLNNLDRTTQSMPPSPTRNGLQVQQHGPYRTRSDPKMAIGNNSTGKEEEEPQHLIDRYLGLFALREQGGEYIQDVTEMTRVPVLLKTDLTKSPP